MPCECDGPGWCSRHLVNKGEHWYGLCQTREDYFNLWEMGEGPGQSDLTDEDKENIKNRIRIEAPNIVRKAWNFGKAITERRFPKKSTKTGWNNVTSVFLETETNVFISHADAS